jgi:hypothetical protein
MQAGELRMRAAAKRLDIVPSAETNMKSIRAGAFVLSGHTSINRVARFPRSMNNPRASEL